MPYEIHTLDMWGHVGADCVEHDCPCMVPDLDNSAEDAPKVHDDDACQCSEDCNQQFRRGTLTVPTDTGKEWHVRDDSAILKALSEEGFAFPPGTIVDDYSDGLLYINDADGRRLLHLIPIEPMQFRVPLVWRRTARYHERLRPHVHQDGRLERFGDGGYPLYYIVTGQWCHGNRVEECVCPTCATDMHDTGNWPDDAMVTHVGVNWEDPDMFCDCGERIPSAYAECDDCDNGNTSTPGEYHEACEDPECPDDHLATCITCKGGGGKLTEERKEEHDAWTAQGQAWMRRNT
jgi:hypothetical protein